MNMKIVNRIKELARVYLDGGGRMKMLSNGDDQGNGSNDGNTYGKDYELVDIGPDDVLNVMNHYKRVMN
jgi:hypothetical protein